MTCTDNLKMSGLSQGDKERYAVIQPRLLQHKPFRLSCSPAYRTVRRIRRQFVVYTLGVPLPMTDSKELRTRLEAEGESVVREKLAAGAYGVITDPFSEVPKVQAWLAEQESERKAAAESRKESREEDSLAIARTASFAATAAAAAASEANEIARSNRRIAIVAAIIAAIAAIISIFSIFKK